MAKPSRGVEASIRSVIEDEERFASIYNNIKSVKGSYLKDDEGVRVGLDIMKGESIKLVRDSLLDESFRDAIAIYHITLRKAVNEGDDEDREGAIEASREEIRNIMDNKTIKHVKYSKLNSRQKENIHRSYMFMTDKGKGKVNSKGKRWKGRWVVNGSTVEVQDSAVNYAATVQPITVMTMINVATVKGYEIATYDVKGAYLVPDVVGEDVDNIVILVDRDVTRIFVELYPWMKEYVQSDGIMYVILLKYLYGLPQAAAAFMNHLFDTLKNLKFMQAKADRCLHVRKGKINTDVLSTGSWVDDIITTGTTDDIEDFEIEFGTFYKISSQKGNYIIYISLEIQRMKDNSRVVSQSEYRKEILITYKDDVKKIKDYVKTPAISTLVTGNDNSERYENTRHYLSIVMALMFMARLSRWDILFVVSWLATKGQGPTKRDYMAVCRVLRYLECRGDYGILYKQKKIQLTICTDASHGLHKDGKGHGGITISLGSGCIHARSNKIKCITLASSETEGYMLCEGGTYVLFMSSLLKVLRANNDTIPLLVQDNLSTIWLQEHEGKFARNKHIIIRDNYTKELIIHNLVKLIQRETEYLEADMLTKIVVLQLMLKHMARCGMIYIGGRLAE